MRMWGWELGEAIAMSTNTCCCPSFLLIWLLPIIWPTQTSLKLNWPPIWSYLVKFDCSRSNFFDQFLPHQSHSKWNIWLIKAESKIKLNQKVRIAAFFPSFNIKKAGFAFIPCTLPCMGFVLGLHNSWSWLSSYHSFSQRCKSKWKEKWKPDIINSSSTSITLDVIRVSADAAQFAQTSFENGNISEATPSMALNSSCLYVRFLINAWKLFHIPYARYTSLVTEDKVYSF